MALTAEGVAKLYAIWQLDSFIQVAKHVSKDFPTRPRQYNDVSHEAAEAMYNIWFKCDTDPLYPGHATRSVILHSMFGACDGVYKSNSNHEVGNEEPVFTKLSKDLRERSRLFVERVFDDGKDALTTAFTDSAISMKAYLNSLLTSQATEIALKSVENIYSQSSMILKDHTITSVFGRPPAKFESWPMDFDGKDVSVDDLFDQNGAQVIEEVSTQLSPHFGTITQDNFIAMQRISRFGFLTLLKVMKLSFSSKEKDALSLIQSTYRWKTAIDALSTQSEDVKKETPREKPKIVRQG